MTGPPILRVVAGILARDDNVLLAQRPAGKELAGLWEFPGGKVETGETDEAALLRELREELGIVIGPVHPLVSVPIRQPYRMLRLVGYRIECWQGEPVPLEGQALRWQSPSTIDCRELAPADQLLLEALCHGPFGMPRPAGCCS